MNRTDKLCITAVGLIALVTGAVAITPSIVRVPKSETQSISQTISNDSRSATQPVLSEVTYVDSREEDSYSSRMLDREDIQGFGDLQQLRPSQSPVFFHDAYKTEEGDIIGRLGAGLYLIDGATGQLMNTFAHTLRKENGKIYSKTGAITEENKVPMSFADFDEDQVDDAIQYDDWGRVSSGDWVLRMFEERPNGVFVKDSESYP